MVIDTSSVIAILLNEPDHDVYIDAIERDPVRMMSSINVLESAMVIEARKREPGAREFDLFLHRAAIDVVPLTAEHVEAARSVWREYGKGNHPAALNFCDCCAYALAGLSGEALLFKGKDFARAGAVSAVQNSD